MIPPRRNGQNTRPAADVLPSPTEPELAHQDKLIRHLRHAMSGNGGVISFSDFMEQALYAPGLGYYTAGRHKFGAPGDFVTAPELGSVFARCLARSCQAVLAELGGGEMLEVGAGSGALAVDLLLALEALDQLPSRYYILELSAELHARQAELLQQKAPHLAARVRWLAQLPREFRGLVLANELLDALPVARFTVTERGLRELYVGWENGTFVWREQPAPQAMRQRIEPLGLSPGYTSEINFPAEAWVRSIADILKQGVLMLIDYGFPRAEFYHPQRDQGTLMCHYRHRTHADPLRLVGLQDISAHVDFSAIAEAGIDAGLTLLGFTPQAAFLLESGMEHVMAGSDPNDARTHLALTQQVKKLTLPHEMGELFKVIALGRGVRQTPPGFTLQDRRSRL